VKYNKTNIVDDNSLNFFSIVAKSKFSR